MPIKGGQFLVRFFFYPMEGGIYSAKMPQFDTGGMNSALQKSSPPRLYEEGHPKNQLLKDIYSLATDFNKQKPFSIFIFSKPGCAGSFKFGVLKLCQFADFQPVGP